MIIHLFKNGTAMINGGQTKVCTTVPQSKGTLYIGDLAIKVDGSAELEKDIESGMYWSHFTRDDGKIYNVGTVSVRTGRAVSLNAESETVIALMHTVDSLEDMCRELKGECEELKNKVEYTSIDFITGGKNK